MTALLWSVRIATGITVGRAGYHGDFLTAVVVAVLGVALATVVKLRIEGGK